MVGGHHESLPTIEFPLPAKLGNADARIEERGNSRVPEGNDRARANESELLVQIWNTRGHLARLGSPVAWWPTLENVADVHVLLRRKAHRRDHAIEQLARSADERQALSVFFGPRSFAHETEVGARVSTSEYSLRA